MGTDTEKSMKTEREERLEAACRHNLANAQAMQDAAKWREERGDEKVAKALRYWATHVEAEARNGLADESSVDDAVAYGTGFTKNGQRIDPARGMRQTGCQRIACHPRPAGGIMTTQQINGFCIGIIGLGIGLWFDWVITIAVFLMMWGDNLSRSGE